MGCSRGPSDKPNILILTLDTTRADYLGCYGSTLGATPHLDQLASGGVRFAEARCQVPITLPSHVSLFTGTYPMQHGVHQHADRFADESIVTLAEILQHEGYATGAILAARVLDERFGLARGFDHYDDDIGFYSDGRPADMRRAGAVVKQAKLVFQEWFGSGSTSGSRAPWFCWTHFYDPHIGYDPPSPFDSGFADDPYAGEVAYMDDEIGKLLAWLRQRGELENTLVVAVADHGESLGQHGIHGHTEYVYQDVLRIPFLLSWPGRIEAGQVVTELAQTVDLVPTVLDYLGLDVGEVVAGRSLRPAVEGKPDTEPVASYFESRYLERVFGWAPLLGVEAGVHKLIVSPGSELYNLA
ncbi:MAG: sulfatase, partial [bacterium]